MTLFIIGAEPSRLMAAARTDRLILNALILDDELDISIRDLCTVFRRRRVKQLVLLLQILQESVLGVFLP